MCLYLSNCIKLLTYSSLGKTRLWAQGISWEMGFKDNTRAEKGWDETPTEGDQCQ